MLPALKAAQIKMTMASEHAGKYGWTQNQKLPRKFGPSRTPPPFIGPKYLTNNNWANMSRWNKAQFSFESATQKAKYINYLFSELKDANWDPKKITWLIAHTIPLLSTEIKGLYYTLKVLRAGGPLSLFDTLIFIFTGLIPILDSYTFGISTRILKKIILDLTPYLLMRTGQLTWYSLKKMLKLLVKLLYYLSKLPSRTLTRIIEMSKKVRTVEKSPKKALSIAYSVTPALTNSAVLRKAGSQPNQRLTPTELERYKRMVKAVTTIAKKSPNFKLKSPSPVFHSARSKSA